MKTLVNLLIILFFSINCVFSQTALENKSFDFTIAFGSCNKQNNPQPFWREI